MLKATIKTDLLKSTIDAMSCVVNDAKFSFKPEGMTTRAIDASGISMVALELKKEAFKSYEATDCLIGVDIEKLSGIMAKLDGSSDTMLTLDEVNRKLLIVGSGFKFNISLIDPSSIRQEPKIPTFTLPVAVAIPGSEIKKIVKAIDGISDHLTIGVADGKFFVDSKSDTDSVHYDSENASIIQGTENAKSMFSMEFMNKLMKPLSKSETVVVEVGNDYPIKFKAILDTDRAWAMYLVAPWVDAE